MNSADFLVDQGTFHFLEINPRPGATLDIFEPADGSLFALHVAACDGRLPDRVPAHDGAMAAAIVYADRDIRVPARDWPDWTADRPHAGTLVKAGEPFVHLVRPRADRRRSEAARGTPATGDPRRCRREGRMSKAPAISVNARAAALVDRLKADAAELKIGVSHGANGETLIDAGAGHPGSIAAGMRIAEICMGGLGTVDLVPSTATTRWPWTIVSRSSHPVIACLASQYAGWRLAHGEGKDAFFALGSGPGRALARKEPLFADIGYRDSATAATLVLESGKPPPPEVVQMVAQDCGLRPEQLTFIYAPTQSLAGSVADRGARARSRDAQGARAQVPARPRGRGHGGGAAVAAASRFRHRHGTHQRRHHLCAAKCICS